MAHKIVKLKTDEEVLEYAQEVLEEFTDEEEDGMDNAGYYLNTLREAILYRQKWKF